MSTVRDEQTIRKDVSQAYAKAVTRSSDCSCCSEPVQKGVAAKLARYSPEELQGLPPEAVANSFGCGNPLAFDDLQEGDVVLDLGSGAGIDLLLAAKRVGSTGRAIGVDMTDEMIAKAHANIAAAGLTNTEVRKGIIEDLPVESGSVDCVISNCVINLSPEKHRVFAEIARVLKPGGRMRVSDIVVTDLPEPVRRSQALYNSCVAGAISEEDYIEGLRNAGLENVEVRERIVYDATQLEGLVDSDLADVGLSQGCCGVSLEGKSLGEYAEAMAGKVWSAIFTAQRP
jgi:SAM-dependent methyltransferase